MKIDLRTIIQFGVIMAVAVGLYLHPTSAAHGQVIHLPTVSTFSVRTTVVVPDAGTAHLGSIRRYRSQRTSRGVPLLSGIPYINRGFRNTAIARESSTGSATVTATIIDLDELDKAVLAEADRRKTLRLGTYNPTTPCSDADCR